MGDMVNNDNVYELFELDFSYVLIEYFVIIR